MSDAKCPGLDFIGGLDTEDSIQAILSGLTYSFHMIHLMRLKLRERISQMV